MKMESIVKKFYDGLDEGKILGRKCTRCGEVEFPPVLMCNSCGYQEMEWVEVSGKGEMYHFVLSNMLHNENEGFKSIKPYCYACVRLEEGTERNLIVRGVTKENKQEIMDKLPVPVKAEILQLDNTKTVVFSMME